MISFLAGFLVGCIVTYLILINGFSKTMEEAKSLLRYIDAHLSKEENDKIEMLIEKYKKMMNQ